MKHLLLFITILMSSITVSFSQTPINDLIENATLVDESPYIDRNVRIIEANFGDGGQNGCDLGTAFQLIYYKFIATSTNNITITVEDSREGWALGDAFAIVYSAPNLNATSDNQLTNVSSCVYGGVTVFTPTIGTNYYILVHRSNGESGYTNITIDIPQYVSASERNALMDIYNNTDGANWTNNTNWNTSEPASSWNGVIVKNGHISKLSFNNNNLVGTIPTSITTGLPYLETTFFQNNYLNGVVPDFSAITTFSELYVSNNNYSFQDLETNYTNNSTLTTFSYQTQKWTDTEDSFDGVIDNNYNLTMTPVAGTNVDYQWFKKRENYFDASDESISGATNSTYAINNLQEGDMDVYFCKATSPIITDLEILRNSIEIKGPVSQADKDALIAIYNATNGVNWNNNTNWLSNESVSTWHGVTVAGNKVTKLDFYDNNLTGTLPPEIGDLTDLQYLSFFIGNSINGTLPPEVGNLTELRVLSFEYNNFTGEIPASYANLTKLRGFWFNNNQLSENVPDFLSTLNSLVFIDVSYNNFQGDLPDLTGLPILRYVNINNNHFYSSDFSDQYNHFLNLQSSWNNTYYYSPQYTLDLEENQSLNEGGDITLNVSESTSRYGSSSRAQVFQWYKDNVLISGATTNPYIITNASMSDSGSYHCVITDPDVPGLEVIRAPIIVDVTLGISENELNEFLIYPVPTKSVLNISTNHVINSIEVFDLLGKRIMHLESPSNKIDVSSLSKGMYLLKIQTENKTVLKRIIKN